MITYLIGTAKEVTLGSKGKVKYHLKDGQLFAEELAMLVYQKRGYNAKWTENIYWWTIMSLLFWETIFAKVKGAVVVRSGGTDLEVDTYDDKFENLFNTTVINMNGMPHDFFTDEFYTRRKSIIINRIRELQNSDIIEKIKLSYKNNYGKNCRPIEDWNRYSIEELITPLVYIDKNIIIEICHRLIKNFSTNRPGLPDLIVYSEKDFFFSEVKSKNDKVSQGQKNWHDFLSENLGLKVELFLINHSETQIANLKKKDQEPSFDVKIAFGKSSSQKRQGAVDFISAQSTFELQGEGKEAIYSAIFNTSDIESLYKMLDLTSGWKTQKIEIGDEIIKSGYLRNSLYCYRQKRSESASNEWCKQSNINDVKQNPFNCKQVYFHEIESDSWNECGYIDTDKGEWVFDKSKINERVEEEVHKLRFCPLFDPKKIRDVIKKLPDRINPKTDTNWAFCSQDYQTWIWHNNKWIASWGDSIFPSFSMMTGIEKIKQSDRKEIISHLSSGSTIKVGISDAILESSSKKQKSGCFVATSIYESYEAWQVILLRKFRDQTLLKSKYGRLFVKYYYIFGPYLSRTINKFRFLQKIFKPVLNLFVNSLNKNSNL